MDTFLQPEELTGNVTIDLVIDEQVTPGAKLHVKLVADETERTVTLGDGFDAEAPEVVVPANGTVFVSFAFDGAGFVPVFSTAKVEADVTALAGRVTALENA